MDDALPRDDVSPTSIRSRILKVVSKGLMVNDHLSRFTHVDPFEDTERQQVSFRGEKLGKVSPTSIRSRILKA